LIHGVLDRDFDLDAWVDPRPLAAARAWLDDYYQTQIKAA